MRWAVRSVIALFAVMLLLIVAVAGLIGGAGGCGTGAPNPPAAGTLTAGQIVQWLETQSLTASAAAGVVGNLQQESSLNPAATGGGLAQWLGERWATLVQFATAQGLSPSSEQAQLGFLVNDLHGPYASLLAQMNAAPDPGTAATEFMSTYEVCDPKYCDPGNRELYATIALSQAGGAAAVPAAFVTGAACAAAPGGYVDPLEHAMGITWERTDQGVDASMTPGSPIVALGDCQVKLIVPFYAGQPAIVCELLDGQLAGDWWYVAEQVTPQVGVGQTVEAGQQIATYAPSGTAIETGWWEPNGGYPLGHDGYNEGLATVAGADFRYLLNQLGAGAGSGAGLSSGTTLGTSDYP